MGWIDQATLYNYIIANEKNTKKESIVSACAAGAVASASIILGSEINVDLISNIIYTIGGLTSISLGARGMISYLHHKKLQPLAEKLTQNDYEYLKYYFKHKAKQAKQISDKAKSIAYTSGAIGLATPVLAHALNIAESTPDISISLATLATAGIAGMVAESKRIDSLNLYSASEQANNVTKDGIQPKPHYDNSVQIIEVLGR